MNRAHVLTLLAALAAASAVHADAFTYHGHLEASGAPASGRYDLRFTVHADPQRPERIAAPIEFAGVDVVDGAFRADFDLPAGSAKAWVSLAIRPTGSAEWIHLAGRTEAIAAPKAIGQCWSSTGDAGSDPLIHFLGTTDAQPLVLRTRNTRSLRIEPSSVLSGGSPITANMIAGSSVNSAASGVRGATIGGGGMPADSDPDYTADAPNVVTDHYGTVAGGYGNRAGNGATPPTDSGAATVGGGTGNIASGSLSTIAGGLGNDAESFASAVGGGFFNVARGASATVAGGQFNEATDAGSTVGGGSDNTAAGNRSTVVGGEFNVALGTTGTVSGGSGNCAGADFSWAGGRGAKVRPGQFPLGGGACSTPTVPGGSGDVGSFVWADAQAGAFVSSGANQFNIRAQGGVGINTAPRDPNVELTVRGRAGDAFGGNADVQLIVDNTNQEGIQFGASAGGPGSNDAAFEIAQSNATTYAPRLTLFGSGAVTIRSNTTAANTGVSMAANAGSWSSLSDRRLKTAVVPVDAAEVLARVLDLPLSTWSYVAQGEAIRHMGPMAQDFASAFGLGENDTTIATIDADGVALAAIQGLNRKLEAERDALRAENATLKARLDRIETLLDVKE